MREEKGGKRKEDIDGRRIEERIRERESCEKTIGEGGGGR